MPRINTPIIITHSCSDDCPTRYNTSNRIYKRLIRMGFDVASSARASFGRNPNRVRDYYMVISATGMIHAVHPDDIGGLHSYTKVRARRWLKATEALGD